MTKKNNNLAADIIGCVKQGTKKWTRTAQMEERDPVSRRYRFARMTRERSIKFKEAAEEIMEEAYNKASGDGRYTALARQIMYAARPHIQRKTGKPLQSAYFTQHLLPNYIEEHGCHHWRTGYDARGHLIEPHGGKIVNLGTNEVRGYLKGIHDPKHVEAELAAANIEFHGPKGNFGALLFIEKEGFGPLLCEANFANRFDIATMSTKGMSVMAARELADEICSKFDIPLLTLTDFDKTGFAISGTLRRDTRRYEFRNVIEVISLGLSLDDVRTLGLAEQFEHQFVPKARRETMEENLRENGASEDEIAFMFADWSARSLRRVELNALTSPQMVEFIERKLKANDIEKIVPSTESLAQAYRLFARNDKVQEVVDEAIKEIDDDEDEIEVPADLEKRVRDYLVKHPTVRWDQAVQEVAGKRPT
jgi:hypothetical protein